MVESAKPLAVDLFCGCGGISAGLRDAGFSILAGSDIEPNYICTFRHNFPEAIAVTDDLATLSPVALMQRLDIGSDEIDLLAGGLPVRDSLRMCRAATAFSTFQTIF
jgi:DNA (cytosine-5)-methyltransferase 1